MNAASTYDPNGTLRTVADQPDYSLTNLARDYTQDQREDYNVRRKQRGTERPYPTVPATRAAVQPEQQHWLAGSGSPYAGHENDSLEGYERNYRIPTKPMADLGNMSGPYFTKDYDAMSARHRQMYAPQNSTSNPTADAQARAIRGGTDEAEWLQWQKEQAVRDAMAQAGNAR